MKASGSGRFLDSYVALDGAGQEPRNLYAVGHLLRQPERDGFPCRLQVGKDCGFRFFSSIYSEVWSAEEILL
jgi:hypothetical protein